MLEVHNISVLPFNNLKPEKRTKSEPLLGIGIQFF